MCCSVYLLCYRVCFCSQVHLGKTCICLYFFLTQEIASFSEESKGSCQILQVAEHCVTSSFNDIYRLQWLTAKLLHKPAVSITCKWNRHQNNLMEKKPTVSLSASIQSCILVFCQYHSLCRSVFLWVKILFPPVFLDLHQLTSSVFCYLESDFIS